MVGKGGLLPRGLNGSQAGRGQATLPKLEVINLGLSSLVFADLEVNH